MLKHAATNILEDSTVTLAAGTEDQAYPLYRLYDRNVKRQFRSTAAETIAIKVDQGATPQPVDTLIIAPGHNLHQIQGSHEHPSGLTVVTGILNAGSYLDLTEADQSYVDVSEVAGTPGFEVETEFTGLAEMYGRLHFAGRYQGNPAHSVIIRMYNYVALTWDQVAIGAELPSSASDVNYHWNIGPNPIAWYYTGTAGNYSAKVRIRHDSSGNTQHKLYMDYLALGAATEMVLSWSDDDVTYTDEHVCTLTDGLVHVHEFPIPVQHRYWKLTINEPAVIPALTELVLTSAYEWERQPVRPVGPFEDVHNATTETTAAGYDRALVHGPSKRQRNYSVLNIPATQMAALNELNNAWQGAYGFWLFDGAVWLFVKLTSPLGLTETAFERYRAQVRVLEVIG